MKYVILIGDGMGDYHRSELGGKTPLEAAHTPNMDRLSGGGLLGRSTTIPAGMEPGSDVANLSLMGYDPAVHHTGRAPLEAASLGIDLAPDQVAFRCNLVILGRDGYGRPLMTDYAAGHITTEQAKPLVEALARELNSDRFAFHHGTSYRQLFVWTGGRDDLTLTPPHDVSGQPVAELLADLTRQAPELYRLTEASWLILPQVGAELGLEPHPTSIWLWGQGRPPSLVGLKEKFGLTGAVISAVDLIKGLGIYAGLEVIEVPGATGWLDTNYQGKVEAGLKALTERDFLFLHVEAPDEAGHTGKLENKMQAIEDFDAQVVGPLVNGLTEAGPFRLVLACDHYTPLSTMTHAADPVPVAIFDSLKDRATGIGFNEAAAAKGPDFGPAHGLMDRLVKG